MSSQSDTQAIEKVNFNNDLNLNQPMEVQLSDFQKKRIINLVNVLNVALECHSNINVQSLQELRDGRVLAKIVISFEKIFNNKHVKLYENDNYKKIYGIIDDWLGEYYQNRSKISTQFKLGNEQDLALTALQVIYIFYRHRAQFPFHEHVIEQQWITDCDVNEWLKTISRVNHNDNMPSASHIHLHDQIMAQVNARANLNSSSISATTLSNFYSNLSSGVNASGIPFNMNMPISLVSPTPIPAHTHVISDMHLYHNNSHSKHNLFHTNIYLPPKNSNNISYAQPVNGNMNAHANLINLTGNASAGGIQVCQTRTQPKQIQSNGSKESLIIANEELKGRIVRREAAIVAFKEKTRQLVDQNNQMLNKIGIYEKEKLICENNYHSVIADRNMKIRELERKADEFAVQSRSSILMLENKLSPLEKELNEIRDQLKAAKTELIKLRNASIQDNEKLKKGEEQLQITCKKLIEEKIEHQITKDYLANKDEELVKMTEKYKQLNDNLIAKNEENIELRKKLSEVDEKVYKTNMENAKLRERGLKRAVIHIPHEYYVEAKRFTKISPEIDLPPILYKN